MQDTRLLVCARKPARRARGFAVVMARPAENRALEDSAIVAVNPEDKVTSETFTVWLDRRRSGEPLELAATAAQTLAEIRAAGE